ncbi:unnamed protein product [Mycena citricolor]|uniref:Uncharacterized protein n=1 Tax=Mycena citricolor TaxID=2018698 RepID=A0AAD2H0S0_9AGAR|nr:unnamed protein product [Mycena citricolor]
MGRDGGSPPSRVKREEGSEKSWTVYRGDGAAGNRRTRRKGDRQRKLAARLSLFLAARIRRVRHYKTVSGSEDPPRPAKMAHGSQRKVAVARSQ